MCRNRFVFEYSGRVEDGPILRDNPYYFNCLQVTKILPLHDGCVNTICWDESGELLLSGSDDRRICVTRVLTDYCEEASVRPIFSLKLPANSNVFTAKFLPQTSNGQIIVGFKCGCVLSVRTDAGPENRVQPVFCHSYAVYDVLTFDDHPTCFLTLSHDQSVHWFDTREPFPFTRFRSVCGHHCSYAGHSSAGKPGAKLTEPGQMRFQFPVTAGDVHPMHGIRQVALGGADGFVRLFDLRRLTKSGVSPMGEADQPIPYQLTRPAGLPAQLTDRRAIRFDYGPAHITSVQFEPLYSVTHRTLPFSYQNSERNPPIFGCRRLLVSHMYAPVFLFDLSESDTSPEPQTVDWLPDPQSMVESPSTDSSHENGSRSTVDSDPEICIAIAFFHWFERQRAHRQETGVQQSSTPQEDEETSDEADEDHPAASDEQPVRIPVSDEDASARSRVSPLERLTGEYVAEVLASAPRARQLMAYRGRRSCRTVIKTATFWGRDYILSGSECGHVISWNRWTGEPVGALKADDTVVNRIAPHPTLTMFACSGIDKTVKIIEPDPRVYDVDDDLAERYAQIVKQRSSEASELCEKNSKYMLDSLRTGSLQFERLARLRTGQALRNILRRLANVNRSSDNQEPPVDSSNP
ncbi:unnamed protein product [Dicrocoelium dendriticum]|nr:unnamed protein product [Dicrocoelium dendriticum]